MKLYALRRKKYRSGHEYLVNKLCMDNEYWTHNFNLYCLFPLNETFKYYVAKHSEAEIVEYNLTEERVLAGL